MNLDIPCTSIYRAILLFPDDPGISRFYCIIFDKHFDFLRKIKEIDYSVWTEQAEAQK